jgi:hypothetical protein
MRIGGVARGQGASASWLRKLERQGKIPRVARDRNGHRRYTPEDVEAIRRVIYPADEESDEATSSPQPAIDLVEVVLRHHHSINGTGYGPGIVKVPLRVAADLEANDARATEAAAR